MHRRRLRDGRHRSKVISSLFIFAHLPREYLSSWISDAMLQEVDEIRRAEFSKPNERLGSGIN